MNNQFGLKPEVIHQIQTVFATFLDIKEAVLYGSRAKGNYKNGSDIDLTLKTTNHVTEQRNKPTLSLTTVGATLDELDLPYSIDLSIYENINTADLIEHIDRVGVVFYTKE